MVVILLSLLIFVVFFTTLREKVGDTFQRPSQSAPKSMACSYRRPEDYVSDSLATQGVFSTYVSGNTFTKSAHMNEPAPVVEGMSLQQCSQFGLCDDGKTCKSSFSGDNCPRMPSTKIVPTYGTTTCTTYCTDPSNVCADATSTKAQYYDCDCSGQYGCCPGTTTKATNIDGSNCATYACGSKYGCCANGTTGRTDLSGTTCAGYGCGSIYGCCPGTTYAASSTGKNCPTYACGSKYGCCGNGTTPRTDISGTDCSGYACMSVYGCCPDGVTGKTTKLGTNCEGYDCGSVYGCCPDGVTGKLTSTGIDCPTPYPYTPYQRGGIIAVNKSPTLTNFQNTNVNANASSSSTTINDVNVNTACNFGYCYDGVTCKIDAAGSNCANFCQYGTCPNGYTCKLDASGTNCGSLCPNGVCSDGVTCKIDASGSNCTIPSPVQSGTNTNTVFIAPPAGVQSNANCPAPQPCPACARCPEPSFECKKVPNYSSTNSEYLPMPVLSDFSTFGM